MQSPARALHRQRYRFPLWERLRHFVTAFDQLGLSEPLLRAVHASGYETATPIQLQAIPPVLAGPRPDGLCPNRHRQDGRVRAADAPSLEHQRQPGAGQRPGAKAQTKRQVSRFVSASRSSANSDVDPRPDARAGRADRPELQDLRPFHRPAIHVRLRRRRTGHAGAGSAERRRRARRHAGPAARPDGARPHQPSQRRDPDPRRSGPDARHGLHRSAAEDRRLGSQERGRR